MGNCGGMWGKMINFAPKSHYNMERMRFLGNIEAKIDAKGRVFLPATFRKVLQAAGVGQQVLRQYVSEAEVMSLDGNGRFLIPKRYLQIADIVQGVRFIGINDAIEIWAVEKTQQPFLPQEEFAEKLKAIMTTTQ